MHLIHDQNDKSVQTARAHERKGKRALDKERKKKVLTERRKVMNIDHLGREKLIDKLHEIHDWWVSGYFFTRAFHGTTADVVLSVTDHKILKIDLIF